jgi:hypothetical protein
MTDMIARQNVSGSSWNLPKINNLRPADSKKDHSNYPGGKMRGHSPRKINFPFAL